MLKFFACSFFLVLGIGSESWAGRCSFAPDYENVDENIFVLSQNVGGLISVFEKNNGPLNADDNGGWGGPHCYSTQLTYEQLQNLQDERLKAAIIRSLNSNSSWQQR